MVQRSPAAAPDRPDLGDDAFARQRVRREDQSLARSARPFAAMADAFDDKFFRGQALCPHRRNSRLPSPPSMGDGRTPMTRQPSSVTAFASRAQTSSWTLGVAHDALFDRRASRFELRLYQRDILACLLRRAPADSARQGQRNKAGVANSKLGCSARCSRFSARASSRSSEVTRASLRCADAAARGRRRQRRHDERPATRAHR